MPGLVALGFVAAVYDTLAVRHGWETISSGVRRIRRAPIGKALYGAVMLVWAAHIEE
jgi:hypothetical protein